MSKNYQGSSNIFNGNRTKLECCHWIFLRHSDSSSLLPGCEASSFPEHWHSDACLVTVPKPVNPADHMQKFLKFGYFLTVMARWLTHFSITTLMSSQYQSARTCPLWVFYVRVPFLWHLAFTCYYFFPNDQQSSCSASTATIFLTAHWTNTEDSFRRKAYIKSLSVFFAYCKSLGPGALFPTRACELCSHLSRKSKNVGLQQLLLPAKARG